MKKIIVFICMALALGLAAQVRAEALSVAVAVAPQKYFVERIAGPGVQVTVLVPANADAHTYEPKPSQMKALAKAKVFMAIGLEFEEAWLPRLKSANPGIRIVRTDEGIAKLMIAEHDHDADHGHKHTEKHTENHADKKAPAKSAAPQATQKGVHDEHLEPDPHIWTSPALVRIQARHIADGLGAADPANKAAYEAGYANFMKEIDNLDAQLKSVFQGLKPGAEFMVFHPSWGYFAKDYGLTQVAIEVHGREPGPRQLKELVEHAKGLSYKVIFVQPQMSAKTAKTVADAIGAKLVQADPMSADWSANLLNMARQFKDAAR